MPPVFARVVEASVDCRSVALGSSCNTKSSMWSFRERRLPVCWYGQLAHDYCSQTILTSQTRCRHAAATAGSSLRTRKKRDREPYLSRKHGISDLAGEPGVSHHILRVNGCRLAGAIVGANCLKKLSMSLPCGPKLTHHSVETCTETVPLFLEEKVRVHLHEL